MDGFAGIVGTTVNELEQCLALMEDSIPYGDSCRIELCTERAPTPEELAETFINIYESGHHSSYPQVQVIDGIAVTSFNLKKGSPQWQLLIPIIVPVLTIGLITFGIFRIQSIANSVLPVLIVAGIIVLGVVIVMAKPAERVTTAYIESPKMKLLPSAKDRGRIDWMPRLGKWRAIVYQGRKDVKLDDYDTREQAVQALQNYIGGGKRNLLAATIPIALPPEVLKDYPELAKVVPEAGTPETLPYEGNYLYHGTQTKRLESIKREGLWSKTRKRNDYGNRRGEYLKEAPDEELLYFDKEFTGSWGGRGKGNIQLRVQEDAIPRNVWVDEDVLREGEMFASSDNSFNIPPEAIEYLDPKTKQWKPLIGELALPKAPALTPEVTLYRGEPIGVRPTTEGPVPFTPDLTVAKGWAGKKGRVVQITMTRDEFDKLPFQKLPDRIATYRLPQELYEKAVATRQLWPENELLDDVHDLWKKACEWENIPTDSKFVVFSDNNPFMNQYRDAVGRLLRMRQLQRGAWQPATKGKSFVQVGDRVRFLPRGTGSKYRRDDWPKDAWLGDKEIDGTVIEYKPELPEVTIRGTKIEGISAWAVVKWDNGADSAIDPEDEGTEWKKLKGDTAAATTKNLPATKPYDPLEYAQYVLSNNMFQEDELPLYKGETGLNPQGVPDAIWQQALMSLGGNFVKLGDLYIISGVGVVEPPNMRKKPDWEADSAEYMAETIQATGWRDKIDQAFQEAVERVHGS